MRTIKIIRQCARWSVGATPTVSDGAARILVKIGKAEYLEKPKQKKKPTRRKAPVKDN